MNDPASGNDTPEHDAQRTLEQRALRNVRVLVESMQAHEEAERRTGMRLAAALGAVLFLIAIGMAVALMEKRAEPKAPVVAPAPAKRLPSPQ